MKIKKIHITNFKRFKELTIDLGDNPKKIIALVGPNGCGKSSVFDAMLSLPGIYGPTIGDYSTIDGSRLAGYMSLDKTHRVNASNIDVIFDSGTYSDIMSKRKNNTQTIFSFRSPYRFNSKLMIKDIKSLNEISKNDYGAPFTMAVDSRMENNYRRILGKYQDLAEKEDIKLSEARERIIGILTQAISNCLNLEIVRIGTVESGKGTLFFKKNDYTDEFEYDVLSAGEKEVVDILVDLYLRRDDYNDTIFIIDEPELHINTSIQRKLLNEIVKMIGNNCQLWIATHSIGLMRALREDFHDDAQIIEFDGENKWAQQAYTLQPIKGTRLEWSRIFGTALDDMTSLIAPKQIIYCEGRDKPGANGKEKGLDAIVYNKIFEIEHPDTLFVSSGGNTELDHNKDIALAVLGKALKETKIFTLKDKDSGSGKDVSTSQRDIYLETNPGSKMLSRREIENYLFDKEVLKAYCKERNLSFDEKTYDSKITSIQDDNVKDEVSLIKNICNIITSIDAETFKKNIAACITKEMVVYKELEKDIFEE